MKLQFNLIRNELINARKLIVFILIGATILGGLLGAFITYRTQDYLLSEQDAYVNTKIQETENKYEIKKIYKLMLEEEKKANQEILNNSYYLVSPLDKIFQVQADLEVIITDGNEIEFETSAESAKWDKLIVSKLIETSGWDLKFPNNNTPEQFWNSFEIKESAIDNIFQIGFVAVGEQESRDLLNNIIDTIPFVLKHYEYPNFSVKLRGVERSIVQYSKVSEDLNKIESKIEEIDKQLNDLDNKSIQIESNPKVKLPKMKTEVIKYSIIGMLTGFLSIIILIISRINSSNIDREMSYLEDQINNKMPFLGFLMNRPFTPLQSYFIDKINVNEEDIDSSQTLKLIKLIDDNNAIDIIIDSHASPQIMSELEGVLDNNPLVVSDLNQLNEMEYNRIQSKNYLLLINIEQYSQANTARKISMMDKLGFNLVGTILC